MDVIIDRRSGLRANGLTRAVLLFEALFPDSDRLQISSATTPGDLRRFIAVGAFSLWPLLLCWANNPSCERKDQFACQRAGRLLLPVGGIWLHI